jgi:predicted neuraminidase
MRFVRIVAFLIIVTPEIVSAEPFHKAELIFPFESWHNHGSCIVECPNGDLIVCWFHGSGERTADDVLIRGARWVKKTGEWTDPFVMADAPGFPDTNCCMIIDPQDRLWLLWPTIQANTWQSALMKYKTSTNYMSPVGSPEWDVMKVMHVKPGDDFEEKVRAKTAAYVERLGTELSGRSLAWANNNYKQAADKLTRRIGWFTRAHPYIVDDNKMLVGLYSDGFSFSLVAITEDWGDTWTFSDPIVGGGNIQPSFARKKDGTLVTYMRDNGPAPKRVLVSESTDEGITWGTVYDHAQLANPGAGLELANLNDGDWICIYNDTERGRHSLAVSISDDEGQTWKWTRHLELEEPGNGSFHYPSIIQAEDGTLHASYSYFAPNKDQGGGEGKSIKYAHFNKDWVLAGDTE